ncbi:hypothetical protein CAPTEDRAFT_227766 [Capitella teleta]|uniref:Polycystin-1 n=1 Tax=Capitella teleta TaxID=283909 RepID=R7VDY9_CAPTE|nr:hypothetical protein CAPTEDRAFT_227766 [Capitella teleta]|eukprot:ELU17058.1 hypothetical protein CAPTEDRAFT_227766 [Capitella teleta]
MSPSPGIRWILGIILLNRVCAEDILDPCSPCPESCNCDVDLQQLCIVNCTSARISDFPALNSLPSNELIIELDLKSNQIPDIPTETFINFTKIEKLNFYGNEIENLTDDVFENLDTLKTLFVLVIVLSKNPLRTVNPQIFANTPSLIALSLVLCELTNLDSNTFSDLKKLRRLSLYGNNFTSLNESLLSGLTLRKLSVSNNPWHCNCDLAWLTNVVREVLPFDDEEIATCLSPDHLASRPLQNLSALRIGCDPPQFVSCDWSSQDAVQVEYSTVHVTQNGIHHCEETCFREGRAYAYFVDVTSVCYCGNAAVSVDDQCPCGGDPIDAPPDESSICGRFFLKDVIKISTNLVIHNLQTKSTSEDIILNVTSSISLDTILWTLTDGLSHVTSSQRSVTFTPTLPGFLDVSIQVTSGRGADSVKTRIRTQCPPSQEDVNKIINAEFGITPEIRIMLNAGTDVWTSWNRENPDGSIVHGARCDIGWTQFEDKCLKLNKNSPKTYEVSAEECEELNSSLLELRDAFELESIVKSVIRENENLFIGAHKFNDTHYRWWREGVGQPYFTSDDVIDPGVGKCVLLTPTGLVGVDCAKELGYICQRDPDPCSYGGAPGGGYLCYNFQSEQSTWHAAQGNCAVLFPGGVLATYHADWGAYLNTSSNETYWVSTPSDLSTVDCYAIYSNQTLHPANCHTLKPYLCQYPQSGAQLLSLSTSMAGTNILPQLETGCSSILPTHLNSSSETILHLLPGLWVSENGALNFWQFIAPEMKAQSELFLQIYRPFCTENNNILAPGCVSSLAMCASSEFDCDGDNVSCGEYEFFCPLSRSCTPLSVPCSCATHSQSQICLKNEIDNLIQPSYQLIHSTHVTVTPSTQKRMYRVETSGLPVQKYDVIGFQYRSSAENPVLYERPTKSTWINKEFVKVISDWLKFEDVVNCTSAPLESVYSIRMIYTKTVELTPPNNLLASLQEGHYYYTLKAENTVSSVSTRFAVHIIEKLSELTVLHPIVQPDGNISAIIGEALDFLFMVTNGNETILTTSSSNATSIFTLECPRDFSICTERIAPNSWFAHLRITILDQDPLTFSALGPVNKLQITLKVNSPDATEIYGLKIQAPAVDWPTVSTDYIFYASVQSGTHILYKWTYLDASLEVSGSGNSFRTKFKEPGVHRIAVTASNRLSTIRTEMLFRVYAKATVENLKVVASDYSIVGAEFCFTVDFDINDCTAITVTADFGDETENDSIIYSHSTQEKAVIAFKHYYPNERDHEIVVTLRDNTDQSVLTELTKHVTVREPLESVKIIAENELIETGSEANFFATEWGEIEPVYFKWNIGENQYFGQNVTHVFLQAGEMTVYLAATNNASTAQIMTTVQIVTPIKGLMLNGPSTVDLGDPVTLKVAVMNGSNIQYCVYFNDQSEPVISTLTSFEYLYQVAGVYNITVEATNQVSAETSWMAVDVKSDVRLRLLGIEFPVCVTANVETKFTAQVSNLDDLRLAYTWIVDGVEIDKEGSEIEYKFTTSILHNISVVVTGGDLTAIKSVDVCVQETIRNLAISMNQTIALSGEYIEFPMKATIEQGSDVNFNWEVQNVRLMSSNHHVSANLTSFGEYLIQVTAYNRVSSVSILDTVTVYEPIYSISIASDSPFFPFVPTQTPIRISSNLTSGSDLTYNWTIDGLETAVSPSFQHIFDQPGIFNLTVIAGNAVLVVANTIEIVAERPVGQLIVTSNVSVVEVGDSVHFDAVVTTGTHLAFVWETCDDCMMLASNSSSLDRTFNETGSHSVKVISSNDISTVVNQTEVQVIPTEEGMAIKIDPLYQDSYVPTGENVSMTAVLGKDANFQFTKWLIIQNNDQIFEHIGYSLEFSFAEPIPYVIHLIGLIPDVGLFADVKHVEAIEPIANVSIRPFVTSANFMDQVTFFASWIGGGSSANLRWSFGSSELNVLPGEHVEMNVTFDKMQDHVLQLHISNLVSSLSTSRTIKVLLQPSICEILFSSVRTPFLPRNESISLTADCQMQELHWRFIWQIEGFSYQGRTVDHSFDDLGTAFVVLAILDAKDSEVFKREVNVEVQDHILGLKVSSLGGFCILDVACEFVVEVDTGSDVVYGWDFGDGTNSTTTTQHIHHIFSNFTETEVLVVAWNQLGSMEASLTVDIVEGIEGLFIQNCCPDVLESSVLISFKAGIVSGTQVSFNWTIQDRPTRASKVPTILHTFEQPGRYQISVTACNQAGCMTIDQHVDVEEKIFRAFLNSNTSFTNIYIDQIIMFYGTVSRGSDVQYEFIVEGSEATIEPGFNILNITQDSITIIFTMDDAYSISMLASNHISQMSSLRTATVKKLMCKPPAIRIVGSLDRIAAKSREITLETVVDACALYLVKHQWTIYPAYPCYNVDYDDTIEPIELPNSMLRPIISGGDEITLMKGETILLDATLSSDPDLPKGVDQGLSYLWNCITVLIVSGVEVPLASIDCISCRENNLFSISNSSIIKLLGTCSNCGLLTTFQWKVVKCNGEVLELDSNTTTTGGNQANLVLKQNVLDNNCTHMFELTATSLLFAASGTAKIVMNPVLPPSGGSCVYRGPSNVVALKDELVVICWFWRANTLGSDPLQYHIYAVDSDSADETGEPRRYPIYRGIQRAVKFYLSPFNYEKGEVDLYVQIIDSRGVDTIALERHLVVESIQPENNETRLSVIMNEVYVNLPLIEQQGNPWAIQQYIIILLLQINGETENVSEIENGNSNDDRLERELMRREILAVMNRSISLTAVHDVQLMAFSLCLITTHADEFPREAASYRVVIDLLDDIINLLEPMVSQGWKGDEFYPKYLLSAVGNVIEMVTLDADTRTSKEVDKLTEYSNENIEDVMLMIDRLLYLLLKTQVANELPFIFEGQHLHSLGVRTTPKNIQEYYTSDHVEIKFPDRLLLHSEEVFQFVSSFGANPFVWGFDQGLDITSRTVSISFSYTNGSKIPIQNLPEDREIMINLDKRIPSELLLGYLTSDSSVTNSVGEMHAFVVTPQSTFSASFRTEKLYSGGLGIILSFVPKVIVERKRPRNGIILEIYVGRGYIPDSNNFDQMTIIDARWTGLEDNRLHTNNTLMAITNEWSTDDEYFITVVNQDDKFSVNVTLMSSVGRCTYYDKNSAAWKGDGCRTEEIDQGWMQCKSNHLTMFGASNVPVVTSLSFPKNEGGSFLVQITVCLVVILSLVLMILVKYLDVLDQRQMSMIPLCGPNGIYKFEVTVVTGQRPGAGTTAKVGLRLCSRNLKCFSRNLYRPGSFQRSSVDVFLVATDEDLDEVDVLRVWHDNTGLNPSWYLNYIIVKNTQNGQKAFFPANCWLSLTDRHQRLQKGIQRADKKQLSSFALQFSNEVSRCFQEHHAWFSIFSCPPYSRMTRVPRLLLCTTMCLSIMSIASIWHSTHSHASHHASLDSAILGVLLPIFIYPLGILVYVLCSYSKVKPRVSDMPRPSSAETIEMDNLVDLGSRGTSASTSNGCMETFHLHDFDRESTSDSLPTKSGPLHRSRPVKLLPLAENDLLVATKEAKEGKESQTSTESQKDNESITTESPKAPPRTKRRILRRRDTIDEILGVDSWSLSSNTSTTEKTDVKGKRKDLPVEFQGPREEATLDDELLAAQVLAELDDVQDIKMTRKISRPIKTLSSEETQTKPEYGALAAPYEPTQRNRSWSTTSDFHVPTTTIPYTAPSHTVAPGCLLPHWTVYVAYVVCILPAFCSLIVVLVLASRMQEPLLWLLSVSMSVLVSMLLLEPAKIIIIAGINSLHGNALDLDVHRFIHPHLDCNPSYRDDGQDLQVRQLRGYPLQQAKEESRKYVQLKSLIQHFVVNLILLWLLLSVNYSAYFYDGHSLNANLKEEVKSSQCNVGLPLRDTLNYTSFWDWVEGTASCVVHLESSDPLTTHSYTLGEARLVQLRSLPVPCPTNRVIVDRECFSQEGPWDKKTLEFQIGSKVTTFEYKSSAELNSIPYHGHLAEYSAGGYVKLLGKSFVESRKRVVELRQMNWIDRSTRLVFLEYTKYNVNKDAFAAVRWAFEFTPSGGVIPGEYIESQRFLTQGHGMSIFVIICQVLLVPISISLAASLVLDMCRQRIKFFCSFWHWIRLVLTALTWASAVLFMLLIVRDNALYTDAVQSINQAEHISLLPLISAREVWRMVNAMALFLMMLILARQLRFLRPLSVFGRTLGHAAPALCGCAFMFTFVHIAFSSLANQWFGGIVGGFRGFRISLVYLVVLLRAHAPFLKTEMLEQSLPFTSVFLLSWLSVVLVVATGLVIAVFSNAYKFVKKDMFFNSTLQPQDYEVVEFMIRRLKTWMGITKPKKVAKTVKFGGTTFEDLEERSRSSSLATSSSCSSDLDFGVDTDLMYERAHTSWQTVLSKIDSVMEIDRDESELEMKIMKSVNREKDSSFATLQRITQSHPSFPPRTRSLSASGMGVKPSNITGIRKSSLTSTHQKRPDSDQGKRPIHRGSTESVLHDEKKAVEEEDALPTESVVMNAWPPS